MRAYLLPPAARHAFGASPALGGFVLLLCAAGLTTTALWIGLGAGHAGRAGKAAGALLVWAVCAALAWRWWRTLPRGELLWDGAAWSVAFEGCSHPVPLACAPGSRLDLQWCLLLRARPVQGPASWLWLVAGGAPADPGAWAAIRRALYSRALAAPAQEGDGPAATFLSEPPR